MLAAFKIRAVPVNVNYRYVEEELRYLFNDADAKAVIFHREFAPKLAAIRDRRARSSTHFVAVEDGSGADVARARRRRLRGRARRLARRARLPAPLGRRPLRALHRRHDRDAEGRDVAPRGHLLRRLRRRRLRRPRHRPTPKQISDKAASRAAPAACPRARSCTAPRTGWRSPRLYSGGTVVISPDRRFDPRAPLGADRARERELPRDRRRRVRASARRRARRARRRGRPLRARRDPLRRRDPLADGEDRSRRAAARVR